MNQAVEFSIVSIPERFSTCAGVLPVQLAQVTQGILPPVDCGDEVVIVTNTGGGAARGCTLVARLMVDDVTTSELWLHAVDTWAQAEVGSPLFRNGNLVAIVVALPIQDSGSSQGLRALRIEAILERLSKRAQLEDAFDNAPDIRFNTDGHARVLVPSAVSALSPDQESCLVSQLGALDQVRRTLAMQ
jgi:hypothetical protein